MKVSIQALCILTLSLLTDCWLLLLANVEYALMPPLCCIVCVHTPLFWPICRCEGCSLGCTILQSSLLNNLTFLSHWAVKQPLAVLRLFSSMTDSSSCSLLLTDLFSPLWGWELSEAVSGSDQYSRGGILSESTALCTFNIIHLPALSKNVQWQL